MRRRGTVALAILCTGSVYASLISAASVSATIVKVDQWNTENSAWQIRGGNRPSAIVNYSVGYSSPRPMSVSLNEVCASEYLLIYNSLHNAWGYQAWFDINVASSSVCPTAGGGHEARGNAVFVQGTWQQDRLLIYANQAPGDEQRRLWCMRTQTLVWPLVGCVTHLSNDGIAWADPQAGEAVWFVTSNFGSYIRWTGGDFNLRSNNLGLQNLGSWYAAYYESEGSERINVDETYDCYDNNPLIKIDYTFGAKNKMSASPPPVVLGYPYTSDHCYLRGAYGLWP